MYDDDAEDTDQPVLLSRYTPEEKAGLIKAGGNWEKYGANMLRWRAIGFVTDVVFPDLLAGMKRADEYGGQIDTDGNVVSEASS